ncbi:MAG: 2-Polyprenyl-6-methoxyphenol hydroxylase or related FAD-dependent oxidoreductase [Pseudomonadota bacterium]|jgi:5-methylphenazine-1-carboxylate 1-monooxygenase
MQVVIAGAGIGGLVLALMLHKRGIEVDVYEAVSELKPLGVGINLLPHAMKELAELGLHEQLAAIAIETSSLSYYNKFGQRIWHEPRGIAAGYDWPQLSIHRGELQMLLHKTAVQKLGASRVHVGHSFESFTQDAHRVTATFNKRSDRSQIETTCDVLVGADGIHSAVRKFLYPINDHLNYSQRILWRAVTEAEPFLDGRSMFMAGHQDQKFVAYPISEPLRKQDRSLINWIAELRVPGEAPTRSDWAKQVDKNVFAEKFADWRWDWINIPELISHAKAIYEYPMVDRNPLPQWTFGRVTLLGDAAHAMFPIGSNGSAQAIVDARYLADSLFNIKDTHYALREYEADRLPKTTGIVLRNRMNGPEQVMQMAEERAPNGFSDIQQVITLKDLEDISLRYKRLAGFDKQSLQRVKP